MRCQTHPPSTARAGALLCALLLPTAAAASPVDSLMNAVQHATAVLRPAPMREKLPVVDPAWLAQLPERLGLEPALHALAPMAVADYRAVAGERARAGTVAAIEQHLSAARWRETTKAHWREALQAEDFHAVKVWLASPLGQRIGAADAEATRAEHEQPAALQHWLRDSAAAAATPERLALLRELDRARGDSELRTQLAIAAAITADTVHSTESGRGAGPDPARVRALLHDRAAIRAVQASASLRRQLFAYRELDEAALERYLAFLHSPAARRLHAATAHAFAHSAAQTNRELHASLDTRINQ